MSLEVVTLRYFGRVWWPIIFDNLFAGYRKMRSRYSVFVTLVVSVWLSAIPSAVLGQPVTGRVLENTYADSVIFIQGEAKFRTGDKDSWTGTGFIVHEKGFVLTNSHVAEDPNKYVRGSIKIKGVPRSKALAMFPLEVIKRDPELDLALLRLPEIGRPWKAVRIGDSNSVRSGQTVFVFGFPLQQDLSFAEGKIANINAKKGRFQTTTPLNRGNSGGPVFDDRGDVVAMVVGGISSAQGINFLIPVNYARGLLRLVGPPW